MADSAGTLERLATEAANALESVAGLFQKDQLLDTLATLGLRFPPDLLADPRFTAAQAAADAAGNLPQQITDLEAAIAADPVDVGAIVDKGTAILTTCGQIFDAFRQLTTQLETVGPGLPGITPQVLQQFLDNLPRKLLDLVLVDHIDGTPIAGAVMTFLGLITRTTHDAVPNDPTQPAWVEKVVNYSAFIDLLRNPTQHFKTLYGWGDPGFDGSTLFPALEGLLTALNLPFMLQPADAGTPEKLEVFAFDFSVDTTPPSPPGLKIDVVLPMGGNVDTQFPSPLPSWNFRAQFDGTIDVGSVGSIRPPASLQLTAPAGSSISGNAQLTATATPTSPLVLLGIAGKSRLEVAGVTMTLGTTFQASTSGVTAEPAIAGSLSGGKMVIDSSDGDGLLTTLLGDKPLEADFETAFAWSPSNGLVLRGSLELDFPVDIAIGPIKLTRIHVGIGLGSPVTGLEISLGIAASLGPVNLVIDRMGALVELSFPPNSDGNLGAVQLSPKFKFPTGIGIAVNSGPVSGGGFLFFDEPNGRYGGALELSIYSVAVKAFGLIETKVPGVAFSFVIVISAEFTPIQLGFGFTLLGVGGLVGINRSVDSQALGDAVRAGTLNNVLFPTNLINNAPAIISELATLFPATDKHYIFGPLAKLGWGTPALVTGTLGLILEIPGSALTILGTILARLPKPDEAIVVIDMDIAGKLDFPKKHFELDASIGKDSKAAGFTISGDMATRIDWGDRPNFAISMGGFHPQFTPPPGFPPMKRLGIDLGISGNPSVTLQGYMALTSNTAQIGAKLDVYASFGATLTGTIGFDALFVFSPFSFDARLYGGVNVHFIVDFGMTFDGHISGPSPWFIHGEVCVSYIFDSACVGIDKTLGGDPVAPLPSIDPWEGSPAPPPQLALGDQDVPGLKPAILEARNWSGRLPPGAVFGVTYVERKQGTATPVDPVGIATFRQKAVPLDYNISRFAGTTPSRPGKLQIVSVTAGGKPVNRSYITDYFAPGQYRKMSNDEALASKPFEQLNAGVELQSTQILVGGAVPHPLTYQTIILNAQGNEVTGPGAGQPHTLPQRHLDGLWQSTSAARSSARLSGATRFIDITQARKIKDTLELFSVTLKATLGLVPNLASGINRSEAAALLDAKAGTSPFIRQQYQIVGSFLAGPAV